jgi:hypothetical protein
MEIQSGAEILLSKPELIAKDIAKVKKIRKAAI